MAMILDFRSRNARAEARDRSEASGAEIIIFPGVHYLRLEDDEDIFAVATAPLKSPSKRK